MNQSRSQQPRASIPPKEQQSAPDQSLSRTDMQGAGGESRRSGPKSSGRRSKAAFEKSRLCYTRRELVEATGISYRTIQHLEKRGLLRRISLGINLACYTAASVMALFGEQAAQKMEVT